MKKLTQFFIISIGLLLSCSAIAGQHFLIISDIHLDNTTRHTMELTPATPAHENDLDKITFNRLMTNLSDYSKKQAPAFVLVLGDLVGHNRTTTDPAQSEATVFRTLKNTFPNTPIFYVFGNNDALKNNYGAFQDETLGSPYDIAQANGWLNGFLSTGHYCDKQTYPCILNENKQHGYYAAKLNETLRLIALNSAMFSEKARGTTEADATNQLTWLEAQLKAAQENQETVLLAMHIPPGTNVYNHASFWRAPEHATFLTLLDAYHDTIIGTFAGHTHAEELKVTKSLQHAAPIGIFLTGGLATIHGNQSCIKIVELSSDQKAIGNYQTWYFSTINEELRLTKLYDFKEYYCAQTIDPFAACLAQVTAEKMKQYFSGGNPLYAGAMQFPDDIFILQKH